MDIKKSLEEKETFLELGKKLETFKYRHRVYEQNDEITESMDIPEGFHDLKPTFDNGILQEVNIEDLSDEIKNEFEDKEDLENEINRLNEIIEKINDVDIPLIIDILSRRMTEEWSEDIDEDRRSRGDIPDGDENY